MNSTEHITGEKAAPIGDLRQEQALAGKALYGNDFTPAEIEDWFNDEREGYFNLYYDSADKTTSATEEYAYESLAQQHGFRYLPNRNYAHALGIGSATGSELLPVLKRSDRVTVLEPSDGFAATELHGKPVSYVKPQPSGAMPFPDETFDLVICFSVLHHIPNVGTVIQEMQRVLRPGGYVLLREPVHSMGDWRYGRRGLTKRERGIPLDIFRKLIADAGLKVVKETSCMFSLTTRLQPLLPKPVWSVSWVVQFDAWLCRLPIWPSRYHAVQTWQKLRPTGVAYVLEKPETSGRSPAGTTN